MATKIIALSEIARDPELAAFFSRGEDDAGSFAVPATPAPVLSGGAAEELELA